MGQKPDNKRKRVQRTNIIIASPRISHTTTSGVFKKVFKNRKSEKLNGQKSNNAVHYVHTICAPSYKYNLNLTSYSNPVCTLIW